MNDEERVRDYLRSRGEVTVPDDLQWPAASPVPRPGLRSARLSSWVGLGSAVVAVLLVGIVLSGPRA